MIKFLKNVFFMTYITLEMYSTRIILVYLIIDLLVTFGDVKSLSFIIENKILIHILLFFTISDIIHLSMYRHYREKYNKNPKKYDIENFTNMIYEKTIFYYISPDEDATMMIKSMIKELITKNSS